MKLSRHIALVVCLFNLAVPLAGHAQPAATNLWNLTLAPSDSESSPAIATDGTIYQATFDGKLVAITPQGEIKWTFKEGEEIKSSPAIAEDGTIYFGARDRKLYAVTPTGRFKWIFVTGAWVDSSPAVGADGTIYFGSWDGKLYALKPDGSPKWVFTTGNIIVSSPAIGADGTVYFGSHDRKFYALKPDGTLRWSFLTGGPVVSSPAIAADGTIYFTSTDGNLYALKPDGTEQWRLHTGGFTESSPVLDVQGQIYLGVNEKKACISPAGDKLWFYGTPCNLDVSPAAAANGLVYFATAWSEFVAMNARGQTTWSATLSSYGMIPNNSMAIATNGVVYFGNGRTLFALAVTNAAPLAESSWPMFRANTHHTGRVSGGN